MGIKIKSLILVLVCLNWVSIATGSQVDSTGTEEMAGKERGAYGVPLGVKLAEFLKWCNDNHVKVTNDSFAGKKKAIEKEVKELLVNNLVHEVNENLQETNTKSLQRQAKKIMGLKLGELKELLVKVRDGKNVPFHLAQFKTEEPLAEIEYIQGPLFLFQYGNEDFILTTFFKDKAEIKRIILDKLQYPRGKNYDQEEVNQDIFGESLVKSAGLIEKLFKSRYCLTMDLQNQEAKDNGLEQIEVLFFRDQNDDLRSYAAVYYYSWDYRDILIKSLITKYGGPKINNSRDSINEISRVANIYLAPCYSNKDFDINIGENSNYATRGWKQNIFIYHAYHETPEQLVYHEMVLWPQILREIENSLDSAMKNYRELINSHGSQVQDRL